MGEGLIDSVERHDRVDAHVLEQRVRDVLADRERREVPLLVRLGVPRTAFSEHGRVVVPRAQAALVPHEVVAHARAAADRALDERFGRMRERVEHIVRQIVGIDERTFGQLGRDRSAPADAREHLQVAHRRHERALVVGCKGRIAPRREVVGRNVDALPVLAQHDADRRPRERHEPSA